MKEVFIVSAVRTPMGSFMEAYQQFRLQNWEQLL